MILSDETTEMIVWNIQRRASDVHDFWPIRFRNASGKEQVDFHDENIAKRKMKDSILEGESEKDYRVVKRSTTTRVIEETV